VNVYYRCRKRKDKLAELTIEMTSDGGLAQGIRNWGLAGNGAKFRKVWNRSSPRRWRLEAQGFNPDHYTHLSKRSGRPAPLSFVWKSVAPSSDSFQVSSVSPNCVQTWNSNSDSLRRSIYLDLAPGVGRFFLCDLCDLLCK
jgi:hypothetical protein